MGHQLDDGSMKLILITLRCGTSLEVGHVASLVGNDQRALKLARIPGIDTEVGAELHRAAYTLGHIHERSIAKHGRVECSVVVVVLRNDAAKILANEIGMFANGLAHRTKDDALFAQGLLERCLHAHAIQHGINSHTG